MCLLTVIKVVYIYFLQMRQLWIFLTVSWIIINKDIFTYK